MKQLKRPVIINACLIAVVVLFTATIAVMLLPGSQASLIFTLVAAQAVCEAVIIVQVVRARARRR